MTKPKLCINSSCKNIMYVADHMMHMCLQCEECVEKRQVVKSISH